MIYLCDMQVSGSIETKGHNRQQTDEDTPDDNAEQNIATVQKEQL